MAFQQRGWHKLEEQTWREVAHHVGLREEAPGAGHRTGADQVAAAATSAPTRKHTLVGRGSSTGNRRETRRTTEAQSRSHHSHRSQHNRHRAKRWKGGFNEMLISSGGGATTEHVPTRAPSHVGRPHPHASPCLWSVGRQYPSGRLRSQPQLLANTAEGVHASTPEQATDSTRSQWLHGGQRGLLPWGPLRASVPEKWLLLVTDHDAAYMQQGEALILEQAPRAPPQRATLPPGQWERLANELIPRSAAQWRQEQQPATTQPQPTPRPTPAPTPQPSQGEPQSPTEPDQSSYMQGSVRTGRDMPPATAAGAAGPCSGSGEALAPPIGCDSAAGAPHTEGKTPCGAAGGQPGRVQTGRGGRGEVPRLPGHRQKTAPRPRERRPRERRRPRGTQPAGGR